MEILEFTLPLLKFRAEGLTSVWLATFLIALALSLLWAARSGRSD